jgi:SAM-dependent methyltransferase
MTQFSFSAESVLAAYEHHPLSAYSVLRRVVSQGQNICSLSEDDLAYDGTSLVTDQNHIGGAEFTLRLAVAAEVRSSDRVLDLGCGLGGPARLLAARCGCMVHGVDMNAARIADAWLLSQLTRLQALTTFEVGSFFELRVEPRYTVVWGQNSWIHVPDRVRLARICREALVPGGRVAFDDLCLSRGLRDAELGVFADLSNAWRSTIVPVDAWAEAFEGAGFQVALVQEDTVPFIEHYRALVRMAEAAPQRYPSHELVGWRSALQLAESGAGGLFRLVAIAR